MMALDISHWIRRLGLSKEDHAASRDSELLELLHGADREQAFAALVMRYGTLILSVCRRVLGHLHDAEDAFQATFIILARRAKSIRKGDCLAAWLHGVAFRVATRMKAESWRRRRRELDAATGTEKQEPMNISARELSALLHAEVERLPNAQRLPLVLCYFEGLTQEAAAKQLGWPRGTLKRRLERARERLRKALTRRDPSLCNVGLAMLEGLFSSSKPGVPAPLREIAIKAGVLASAGNAVPLSLVSQSVLTSVQGVLRTMAIAKLRFIVGGFVAIIVAGAGLWLHSAFAGSGPAKGSGEPAPPHSSSSVKESPPSSSSDRLADAPSDLERLKGTWRILRGESQGIELPKSGLEKLRLAFDDTDFTWSTVGQGGLSGGYKINSKKEPGEIDFNGDGRLPAHGGTYKFDGKKLLLALSPNGERPKNFVTGPKTTFLVYELERVEAKEQPKGSTKHEASKGVPDLPPAPLPKGSSAEIYWLTHKTGNKDTDDICQLEKPEQLTALEAFFPELTSGKAGRAEGDWAGLGKPQILIIFYPADRKQPDGITVHIDPTYRKWSSGGQEWDAPPGLKKYLDGILEAEHADRNRPNPPLPPKPPR